MPLERKVCYCKEWWFAVSAFWRVQTEGLTRSLQSVAGRDQTRSHFRETTPFMCSPTVAPRWGGCKYIRGRGGGRGHTHSRGGEGGCLPERCRSPQDKWTPLHLAANKGHAAVVELLLAARARVDAKDEVRGGGVRIGQGWVVEHCPLGFLVLCFLSLG